MEAQYKISQIFIQTHPQEATRLLENLPMEETVSFLADISVDTAAQVIELMGLSAAIQCLKLLAPEKSGDILKTFHLDTMALLCRRLTTQERDPILKVLPNDIKTPLNMRLSFPEGSAGALMDPQVLTLSPDLSASVALQRVRTYANQAMYYLYVVNENHELVGVLNVRELMLAPPNALISSLMHTHLEKLSVLASYQTILEHTGWQKVHAIPVVDNANMFVGTIRYETLRRIEQDVRTHLSTDGIQTVGTALGELYRIGLSGLMSSTTPPHPSQGSSQ
jgi:magnesium transporter